MRHKDGFEVWVHHQHKYLKEYDAVSGPDVSAPDAGETMLHAGNYTDRRSRFYVTPDKSGLHRMMNIAFFLDKAFDFQGGNIVHITMRINGTTAKDPARSQLIWKHRLPGVNVEATGRRFDWLAPSHQEHATGDFGRKNENVSLVITIKRGFSDQRWEDDSLKAMKAFKRIPGESHVIQIMCRPFGSPPSKNSILDVTSKREKGKSGRARGGLNAMRYLKAKCAETKKKHCVNANTSATKGERGHRGKGKQAASHEVATSQAPTPLPSMTASTTPPTHKKRTWSQAYPESDKENERVMKRKAASSMRLTKQLNDEEPEVVLEKIKDKKLVLKTARLQIKENKVKTELNALHKRLKLLISSSQHQGKYLSQRVSTDGEEL
ncbi:hypothetical protein Q7P37_010855 [Cladosporium fusiforme]